MLPDDATIEDIVESLIFQENVDPGHQELHKGKFIPHAQMEGEITELLKRLPQSLMYTGRHGARANFY